MAFFEKLSKTVTEASQKTIAKTKEFADTSKMKSMISDEEKNITNQYLQIGKMYTTIHKHDYEEEFAEMFNTILEAESKISNYKKQIQEIKGTQCCKNCGAEVPNGAAFCSTCGNPMEAFLDNPDSSEDETDAPQEKGCPNCGAKLNKDAAFCVECGTKL